MLILFVMGVQIARRRNFKRKNIIRTFTSEFNERINILVSPCITKLDNRGTGQSIKERVNKIPLGMQGAKMHRQQIQQSSDSTSCYLIFLYKFFFCSIHHLCLYFFLTSLNASSLIDMSFLLLSTMYRKFPRYNTSYRSTPSVLLLVSSFLLSSFST